MQHSPNLRQATAFFSLLYRSDIIDLSEVAKFWPLDWSVSKLFFPTQNPLLSYYEKEMGAPLKRCLLWHPFMMPRQQLIGLKKFATDLESIFCDEQKRRFINIDPGLVCLEQVLLATHKPYGHRIYLQDDVWAELVYTYEGKQWKDLPWTYPDYCAEEKKVFFDGCREQMRTNGVRLWNEQQQLSRLGSGNVWA